MDNSSTALFTVALGLTSPWRVERTDFSAESQQLDLWLDFASGATFSCPECQRAGCKVHDTTERTWRHLDFFQHRTLLHARQPRVHCPEHGVKTVSVPWARPGSGFTLLMEAFVMALIENGMTPRSVGRLIGEHDTRIWRLLDHYVQIARKEEDFSDVRALGVDETSRRRGHKYVTVFTDLQQSKVLFVTEGKDAATIGAFKEDLKAHGGSPGQIQEVCLDMSAAFAKGLKESFPQAELTFDNFHLVQVLNRAVDDVRRKEQASHPELKCTRYLWLKNEWNRSDREKEIFESLRDSSLATMKAFQLRTVFQDIFALPDPQEAEAALTRWYFWATHSRLGPMIKAARTIKRHWEGVMRWFHSRLTNAQSEAINGLIQSAKRRARGYRSTKYLITMIYVIGAKLEFKLPKLRVDFAHTK